MNRNLLKLLSLTLLVFFMAASSVFARQSNAPYKIVQDPEGVYIIEVNTNQSKYKLMPYYTDELSTNHSVYKETGARFVVNTGFFDPKNMKTVSYVTIDSDVVLNPEDNENLMNNKALKPYLNKILNRSEFRILKDAE
ncbi:hypothetical protein II906_07035, partial [bacterium]|nr:hypothetical protein [bacterium]